MLPEIVFWTSTGALAWVYAGYPAAVVVMARLTPRGRRWREMLGMDPPCQPDGLPGVPAWLGILVLTLTQSFATTSYGPLVVGSLVVLPLLGYTDRRAAPARDHE